jgi:hypothetical protein
MVIILTHEVVDENRWFTRRNAGNDG